MFNQNNTFLGDPHNNALVLLVVYALVFVVKDSTLNLLWVFEGENHTALMLRCRVML